MSRITPLLFLGSADEAQNITFLKSHKIKTIVNAALEVPNYFPGEFEYVRLELDDTPKQSLSKVLDPISIKIIQNMKDGKVTFVHCYAGISRSSSIVIYTLMKLHQWNYERAFKFVKDLHPNTQPNPGFIEQLVMRNTAINRIGTTVISSSTTNKNYETVIPEEFIDSPQVNKQPPPSQYKRLDIPEEHTEKKWSQLTFDCPECDQPDYTPSRRGIYARIFS